MNPLFISLAFLAAPQDTGIVSVQGPLADSSQVLHRGAQALPVASLAPRMTNLSLLRSAVSPDEMPMFPADTEPGTRRPRAVRYSDAYYTRLTIHKYASYLTVPLFAAEYVVGQQLYNNGGDGGNRGLHSTLAGGIAGLFAVNTVTGSGTSSRAGASRKAASGAGSTAC